MSDLSPEIALTEDEIAAEVNQDYATKYGFSDTEDYIFKAERGLNEAVIRHLSAGKNEPEWMLDIRLKAYQHFLDRPMPEWGADLSEIDFDNIYYYIKPSERQGDNWEDIPSYIKNTFDKLGIPQAEQKYLSGVAAQYESEVVYHNIKKELEDKGVIFLGMDDGLAKYPELVKEYFTTIIPYNDNKFAALNTAVWSGGSFIYVPPGVHIEMPLQAYFRINAKNVGQFERTLIIIDEGAYVHYVEGCTAPIYSSDSLHSAVVEIIVKKNGRCRYTTIQNWSNNVFNLVTKRAVAYENATMEWVDGNLGSKVTMKYPAVHLMESGAHGEILSIAFAGRGQHQDAGGKVVHHAPNTTSRIISKSICKDGGRSSYRGLLKIDENAKNSKSNVVCDALLLDPESRSDTYPYIEIENKDVNVGHEASVSKVGEEQLFYLMSRGITEEMANTLIVNGFIGAFSEQIRVVGEASEPKAILYNDSMTVLDVMIQVGGLTDFADGNKTTLIRMENGQQNQFNVRLEDLIKDGDITANVDMRPGDIMIIPEAWF